MEVFSYMGNKRIRVKGLDPLQKLIIIGLIVILPLSALMVAWVRTNAYGSVVNKSSIMRIDYKVVNNINARFETLTRFSDDSRSSSLDEEQMEYLKSPEIQEQFAQIFEELNTQFAEHGITEDMYYAEIENVYSELEVGLNSDYTASVRGFVLYTWMVSLVIDSVLLATGSFAAYAGIKVMGKIFGKSLAKKFTNAIAKPLLWAVEKIACATMNVAVGSVANSLINYFWAISSLGGLVSFVFDIIVDGRQDGVIWRA